MDNESKLRLLYIGKMLQDTDEAHPLTNAEMMQILEDKYGMTTHRTTIPSDIDLLIKSGMEIEIIESKPKKYYLNDYARTFNLPELKMLVDAVASSKFITKKKSDELIEKIITLGTPSSRPSLKRNLWSEGRIKQENERIYFNIEAVNQAINEVKKISFQYLKYTIDDLEKQTERRKGAKYIVSPYKLIINDGNYYLLAFDDYSHEMRTYRVDRMKSINRIGEPREGAEAFAAIDMKTYTQRVFSMYGGEKQRVGIRFVSSLLDTAVERFGRTNVNYSRSDDHHFTVFADVEISDQFFGWICGFGTKAQLLSPSTVVNDFTSYLERIQNKYKGE